MYESSSTLSSSEESIVRWEMMTRQIIPAVPMATYGEVVRMVKGRPSEIDTEAATFQKVDLPSGGTVILANYPLGTSNETSDEEYSATTQKYRRLSSPSHRYSKGSSEEVVKGLNSPVQNIQDDREARTPNIPSICMTNNQLCSSPSTKHLPAAVAELHLQVTRLGRTVFDHILPMIATACTTTSTILDIPPTIRLCVDTDFRLQLACTETILHAVHLHTEVILTTALKDIYLCRTTKEEVNEEEEAVVVVAAKKVEEENATRIVTNQIQGPLEPFTLAIWRAT